jgi:hypothetical protein
MITGFIPAGYHWKRPDGSVTRLRFLTVEQARAERDAACRVCGALHPRKAA